MTNTELAKYLLEFPEMEVLLDRNGIIHTEVAKPIKKFMGTAQKEYIVLYSPIKIK